MSCPFCPRGMILPEMIMILSVGLPVDSASLSRNVFQFRT
jgi:hypothetical protein